MAENILKWSAGGGGGGTSGVGGGGGSVESTLGGGDSDACSSLAVLDADDAEDKGGTLHRLLPNIAEAIEMLEEATVDDVQKKIEELTNLKHSKSEVYLGLENGLKLGLFDVVREFHVNSDYLTEMLKTDKRDRKAIAVLVRRRMQEEGEDEGGAEDVDASPSSSARSRKGRGKLGKCGDEPGQQHRSKPTQKICHRCKQKFSLDSTDIRSEGFSHESDSETSKASRSKPRSAVKKRSGVIREETSAKRKKLPSPGPQEDSLKSNHYPLRHSGKQKLLVERNRLKNEALQLMFT